MAVTYLICAAGRGLRTKILEPTIPKPLLKLQGKTFLSWSLSSLPATPNDEVVIICQERHFIEREQETLNLQFPQWRWQWLNLSNFTRGQLETAVLGFLSRTPKNSVVIFNSDTYFQANQLAEAIQSSNAEVLVPCSTERGEAWSFCDVENGWVTSLYEKKRKNTQSAVGFYFFRDPALFLKFAKEELASQPSSQAAIAPLVNRYIRNGYSVAAIEAEVFKPMGSVTQIRDFWGGREAVI